MNDIFDLLPDELIMHIFSFLNSQTLGRLASTCKRFKIIVNRDEFVWQPLTVSLLGTNLKSTSMRSRCRPLLTMKDRCRVARNWESCNYRSRVIRKYQKAMPYLQLDQLFLYSSDRNRLFRFKRNCDGSAIITDHVERVRGHSGDICKFVLNGQELVSGSSDGLVVRRFKSDFCRIGSTKCHEKDLQTLDAKDDILVTGDKDGIIKTWKVGERYSKFVQESSVGVRILSLAIMPSKQHFICGLPGTKDIHPLKLYDLQNCRPIRSFGQTFKKGAGILDIFPECQNTFLCCSCDTTVQLWDIRTPNGCVSKWEDPYDNSIYTVKSDYNVTIVSGASRNSVVQIWDKRMKRNKHILSLRYFNSPTYSIVFDGSYIFAAFDRGLLELCFLGDLFGCNQCMVCRTKYNYRYLHVV